MNSVQLQDLHFKSYIEAKEIDTIVANLAEKVYTDCRDETPLFIGILNGSFVFVADFVRAYKGTC